MEKECKHCKKIIVYEKHQQYSAHIGSCKLNPNYENRNKKLSLILKNNSNRYSNYIERLNYELKCGKCSKSYNLTLKITDYEKGNYRKFCCRACANSRKWDKDDKIKKSNSAKKSEKVLRNNIKKEKNYRICLTCNKKYKSPLSRVNSKFCSRECIDYKKINKNSGGYREGSGNGKSGWYKGYFCSSTYELAFVIYNIEHNIVFKRNNEGFKYVYNNKEHLFYPDFIVNGEYIEIKGYDNEKLKYKLNHFPHKIKVLYKNDLKCMFDYVTGKYGDDFIKLYDGNPHNRLTKKCLVCGNDCKEKNIVCSRICSGKLVLTKKPKIMSEDTKNKISDGLIKYNKNK